MDRKQETEFILGCISWGALLAIMVILSILHIFGVK